VKGFNAASHAISKQAVTSQLHAGDVRWSIGNSHLWRDALDSGEAPIEAVFFWRPFLAKETAAS
jgi:hypothetical protein